MPLSDVAVESAVVNFQTHIAAEQEPVTRDIDIYEAIARSLKYDLDYRIEVAQEAVSRKNYDISNDAMVPTLVASSGYAGRNNKSASSSQNLATGIENFSFSTSQDRFSQNADLEFGWSILDFGLSYVRAQQAGDTALIASEMRRKVLARMIANVRAAFWRAYCLQRLIARFEKVRSRVRSAHANAVKTSSGEAVSRLSGLMRRRELLEMERRLNDMRKSLTTAKIELAALMNLDPSQEFRLKAPHSFLEAAPPELPHAVHLALTRRPELRELLYQQRINAWEREAALIELLPGIRLSATSNFDSNSYLLNANWVGMAASVTGNLMRLFAYPNKEKLIGLHDDLLETRGRAVVVAVVTQVYASYARHAAAKAEVISAREYSKVQHQLLRQMKVEAEAEKISVFSLVREELNALIADTQHDLANAALMEAQAGIEASIGVEDMDVERVSEASVEGLADALRASAGEWRRHTTTSRQAP